MKRKEKIVIQGNEFYVIDLDCLERKEKGNAKNAESGDSDNSRNLPTKKRGTMKNSN